MTAALGSGCETQTLSCLLPVRGAAKASTRCQSETTLGSTANP